MIKEKKQFQVGTIGVARTSRAPDIMSSAVDNVLSTAQQIFTERSKDKAMRTGEEMAQALSAEEVVAIDYNTGLPKAYRAGQKLGKYAMEAYERVYLQRFQEQVGLDLETEAKSLAIKFERNPEGFAEAFNSHVDSIANVEGQGNNKFTNFVGALGEKINNQYYFSLKKAQQDRANADLVLSYENSFARKQDELRALYAANKIEDAEQLLQSMRQADADIIATGLVTSTQLEANDQKYKTSKALGLIENQIRTVKASLADQQRLRMALDSGDPDQIPDAYKNLREVLQTAPYAVKSALQQFGTELMEDQIVLRQFETNQRQLENLRRESNGEFKPSAVNNRVQNAAGDPSKLEAAIDRLVGDIDASSNSANNFLRSGGSADIASTFGANSRNELNLLAQETVRNLFATANTVSDVQSIEQALREGNSELAPEGSAQRYVEALMSMDSGLATNEYTNLGISYAASVNSNVSFRQNQEQSVAYIDASNRANNAGFELGQATSYEDLFSKAEKLYPSIGDGLNLRTEDAERLGKLMDEYVTRNAIRLGFKDANTSGKIAVVRDYLFNGKVQDQEKLLTAEEIKLLDLARSRQTDESTFRSDIGAYLQTANQRVLAIADQTKRAKLLSGIQSGLADPNDEESRVLIDSALKIPEDFFYNPEYLNDPTYDNVRQALYGAQGVSTNIMSENLYKSIQALYNGALPVNADISMLISHYDNMSTYVTPDYGVEMASGAVSALDADTRAFMETLTGYAQVRPNVNSQNLSAFAAELKQYVKNPDNLKAMNNYFSELNEKDKAQNLDQYIAINFRETANNPDLRRQVKAEAIYGYASMSIDPEAVPDMNAKLRSFIDKVYVEDINVLGEFDNVKTLYPLDRTTGNNSEMFLNYVQDQYVKYGDAEGDLSQTFLQLRAVGRNTTDNGVTYAVILDDGRVARGNVDVVNPETGQLETVNIPMYVSTREQEFLSLVEQFGASASEIQKAKDLDKAESLQIEAGTETQMAKLKTNYNSIKVPSGIDFNEDTLFNFNRFPELSYSMKVQSINQMLVESENLQSRTNDRVVLQFQQDLRGLLEILAAER